MLAVLKLSIVSAGFRTRRCTAAGAPAPDIRYSEYTPALVNDPGWTERLRDLLSGELGEERVVDFPPVMTAEDFGRFGRAGIPHR